MEIIERNSIRCVRCKDEIESVHHHDLKFCSCGGVAVDGGKDYRRRLYGGVDGCDYEDTSIYTVVTDDDAN